MNFDSWNACAATRRQSHPGIVADSRKSASYGESVPVSAVRNWLFARDWKPRRSRKYFLYSAPRRPDFRFASRNLFSASSSAGALRRTAQTIGCGGPMAGLMMRFVNSPARSAARFSAATV